MMYTNTNNTAAVTADTGETGQHNLASHVKQAVKAYFQDCDGHDPSDLYELVLHEIEKPLLETVMDQVRGNQSRAARLLGINRSTLRKKLALHGLCD